LPFIFQGELPVLKLKHNILPCSGPLVSFRDSFIIGGVVVENILLTDRGILVEIPAATDPLGRDRKIIGLL